MTKRPRPLLFSHMKKSEDYVTVGRLRGPHGLKGEMELTVLTDFPERFQPGAKFILWPPLPQCSELVVDAARQKGRGMIVKFAGIDDRRGAEEISGRELLISAFELTPLPENAYWHHDLLGLRVYTAEGEEIGVITEILSGAANDIYVVENERKYLIPAIGDVVKEIDLKAGRMVIEPLPGLLE